MDWSLPRPKLRSLAVWQRNVLVWRRLMLPSLMGNFGDPLLYLLGLGYGLGLYIGHMAGMPYLVFLASGIVASSAMNTATFEGLYSAFTRMSHQQTYAAMLATPLQVDDILAGEMLWCASKSLISGLAILLVAAFFGAVQGPQALWAIPLIFLTGLAFAGPALAITAVAPSYDFFMYYFTLVLTPMFLFSGVFYPIDTLPALLQGAAQLLPLTHAVALLRPVISGGVVSHGWLHVLVLLGYALLGYYLATVLVRRRLLV
ncbi:MAG: ABC transporter permease [Pseudomonadota bacterium]|uniref:ABC transporter permease n=1 Tax=Thermithiobacillus tepidarius TaxID=929 RepID=UPI000414D6D2|nr:ABC transporter permease [Thermithiobacillus tepidarius]